MEQGMITRHSKFAIFMHWFNAACWLFLLATGLGLIDNGTLSPVGTGWPHMLKQLFNGGGNLLAAHVTVGITWSLMFLVFAITNPKKNFIEFVKEIFAISVKRDLTWLVKKGIIMTCGKQVLEKRNIDAELPEQGFYNFGQKLFAIPSLLGGFLIVATGYLMMVSMWVNINAQLVQWSIFLHFLMVGLLVAGLVIHIYMAAIVAEEKPAFFSMFTGKVPIDFARHHNSLWFKKISKDEA
ncbi:MAG: cytochrome B6 [Deltaproteobacteria bacterium]|jgi:formate dehydrogenase subunit gamma|nr:cytochrome B6 [Deltaproteobacteria bacterium]